MHGFSCGLDHLIADVQRLKSLNTPAKDLGWLGEAAQQELSNYIEGYLRREVETDVRYLVEDRVRAAWGKIIASLRALDEPTAANVRARIHDLCRREKWNELKRKAVRLRAPAPPLGEDPLAGVAAPVASEPQATVEAASSCALLLRSVAHASQIIPETYNVWRLLQNGLTHEAVAEQFQITGRMVRYHEESFQAFVVFDLMEQGLQEQDVVGLGLGIKREAVKRLISKGRKFQRQRKQKRSRRDAKH